MRPRPDPSVPDFQLFQTSCPTCSGFGNCLYAFTGKGYHCAPTASKKTIAPAMPLIQTRTLKTYYEMAGFGAPVLVLSGTGGDLRKKPTIMDSPLTAGFTVISYDQRGLGQSEKPQDGYTMANYAEDAVALMDALDIESAHVLGISFGGMVAQEFALAHPTAEASGAVLHLPRWRRRYFLPA